MLAIRFSIAEIDADSSPIVYRWTLPLLCVGRVHSKLANCIAADDAAHYVSPCLALPFYPIRPHFF